MLPSPCEPSAPSLLVTTLGENLLAFAQATVRAPTALFLVASTQDLPAGAQRIDGVVDPLPRPRAAALWERLHAPTDGAPRLLVAFAAGDLAGRLVLGRGPQDAPFANDERSRFAALGPVAAQLMRAQSDVLGHPVRARPASVPLSPREAQIARLLATGHSILNAAAQLELSENTIRTYVRRIYKKLAIANRAELTTRCNELCLL